MIRRDSLQVVAVACVIWSASAGSTLAQPPPKAASDQSQTDPAKVDFFEKKVRPVLARDCFECHGSDQQQSGLRLDSRAAILEGGNSGPAVDLLQPGQSLLLRAVRPAPESAAEAHSDKKLRADEIAALAAWIKMGAPWPETEGSARPNSSDTAGLFSEEQRSFWSFQPLVDPALPAVKNTGWVKSPLDQLILVKLEEKGLEPAPPADKRALIRRATYDLTGLPPTPEEVDAFLADKSPDAFAKVVERLLASPHYGERWGRHWLDVARYADSNGMDENIAYSHAFHYRDYVVAAFNKGKPYDQFVREQLAGDLMPVPSDVAATIERQTATGFLAVGPKMLAEDDPVKMRVDIVDEQIDTLGRTFMGLSLGCARCHDHKFDPIPTEDYYSLAGIFLSTKTMENYKVVAQWYERPLGSEEEIAQQQAQKKEVEATESRIANTIRAANERLLSEARRQVGRYLLAASELGRQRAARASLEAIMSTASGSKTSGLILIEAEDYTRGDATKDFDRYGRGIGVLVSRGRSLKFAEYDVDVAAAGAYQIELRYAADESRPVRLSINGQLFTPTAAARVTGGQFPNAQKWGVEGAVPLRAGKNTVRLEGASEFPHVDKLALVPRKSTAGIPKTSAQIGAEYRLNPLILNNWARYLERTKNDPNSVLATWHALDAQAAQVRSAGGSPVKDASRDTAGQSAAPTPPNPPLPRGGTPTPPNPHLRRGGTFAGLFSEFFAESRRQLANHYQELFEQAEEAWRELKASAQGESVEKLPDPALEAFRQVLYARRGPFARIRRAESYYPTETLAQLNRLREELESLNQSMPQIPSAMGATEGKIENTRVNIRGSHINLGKEAPRQFPQILAGENQTPIDDKQSGRLQLARWLTRDDHPLTPRVMVNRIWRWHFGTGIVRTTDNFGSTGERPVNPELLDWLALRFIESGWSVKAMHRIIMLSATYQMSTAYNERAALIDPGNRLHWRMNRRRLEAESIRDAILALSGTLDLTIGGGLLTTENREYVRPGRDSFEARHYDTNRRSIYIPVIRSVMYDVFQAFDFPEPAAMDGDRSSTTIAPQALFMLNSSLVEKQTRSLAEGLLARQDLNDQGRIRLAYRGAYGRPPSAKESERSLAFLERYEQTLVTREADPAQRRVRAWQGLCRAIVSANEFIYVD